MPGTHAATRSTSINLQVFNDSLLGNVPAFNYFQAFSNKLSMCAGHMSIIHLIQYKKNKGL